MRRKDARILNFMTKTIILIPSRLSASRLPNKPLLKINNKSLISHVYEKGQATNIGDVYVATGDKKIFEEIVKNKGKGILTKKNHLTGTDRIFEAYELLNINNVDYIMSLQGDEPAINPKDIKNLYHFMAKYNPDIGTLASEVKENSMLHNENIVKVKTIKKLKKDNFVEAINFSRKDLSKESSNVYHHIGIYCYKISALKKFVNLEQTKNEIKNRLEQLRAIDNSMQINVALAKFSPIGIDTEEDYLALKKIMEYKS